MVLDTAVQIAIISSCTQIILMVVNTLLNRDNSRKLDKVLKNKKENKKIEWPKP